MHKGFTLIEMMVVVVIVSMLVGVAVISLDSLTPTSELNAEARKLVATLNYAYSRAAMLGRPVTIEYQLDKQYYRIQIPIKKNSKKMQPSKPKQLPENVSFEDIVYEDVKGFKKQTSGWLKIKFSPLGHVPAHLIHLRHKKGGQISLEINPITGMCKMREGYQPIRFITKEN